MNEQEKELHYKTSIIFGKDTRCMKLNEIIAKLVNMLETNTKNKKE